MHWFGWFEFGDFLLLFVPFCAKECLRTARGEVKGWMACAIGEVLENLWFVYLKNRIKAIMYRNIEFQTSKASTVLPLLHKTATTIRNASSERIKRAGAEKKNIWVWVCKILFNILIPLCFHMQLSSLNNLPRALSQSSKGSWLTRNLRKLWPVDILRCAHFWLPFLSAH